MQCTSSVAAPIADTIGSGFFTAATIGYAVSAVTGYRNASGCSEVKDLNGRYMGGDMGACRQLKADWTSATLSGLSEQQPRSQEVAVPPPSR